MRKNRGHIASLARLYTDTAIKTLAGMREPNCPPMARVAAAKVLLDRGWGKPKEMHHSEVDDNKPLPALADENSASALVLTEEFAQHAPVAKEVFVSGMRRKWSSSRDRIRRCRPEPCAPSISGKNFLQRAPPNQPVSTCHSPSPLARQRRCRRICHSIKLGLSD
jgi:hypothetical protein